jgi:succinate dehydrogenase / fumarate reductase cytochrome b subunit
MIRVPNFWRSPLGKKSVMAVTGLMLFSFVLVHLWGNLKLYEGPEKLDNYAEFLRTVGAPFLGRGQALWIARIGLIAVAALHIFTAVQLTLINRRARPVEYGVRAYVQTNYAARTMVWSGPIIALFVGYHLLHFTFGSAHPDYIHGEVYHNVVAGFRNYWSSGVYIVAMLFLGLHMYHGLWSMFQSLGLNHPKYNSWRRSFAAIAAAGVTIGNISFPVAVITGLVR